MSDVFLSHKSHDAERLRPLVALLEAQGWEVWWSQDDIRAGADWSETIDRALADARCIVVVWSEASVAGDTDWVMSEAEAARKAGKLVPVRLDPVDLPKPFDRVQTADLTDWVPGTAHDGLERLVAGVAATLDSKVDYRRLPRPGLPLAHALVAGAGLLATVGPTIYVARSGPAPPLLYLLLGLIAVAAGAATFSLIRGLFPWGFLGFRSLRNLKPAVALAASLLVAAAAAFLGILLAAPGTPVAVEVCVDCDENSPPDLRCPPDLRGARGFLEVLADAASARDSARELRSRTPIELGDDCRASARLRPAVVAEGSATIRLGPEAGYVTVDPFAVYPLADLELAVAVRPVSTPRVRLAVLNYEGSAEGDLARFRRALGGKLDDLKVLLRRGEVESDDIDRWLVDLALESTPPVEIATASDRDRLEYLEATHSLGLLWGEIGTEGPEETLASRIFVGDAALTGSPFQLASPVSGSGFAAARDGHAAAFLYALALDARRLGEPHPTVMAFLSEATEQLLTVESDEARRLRGKIEEVAAEIRQAEVDP